MRPVVLLTDWIIEPIRRLLPAHRHDRFQPDGGLAGPLGGARLRARSAVIEATPHVRRADPAAGAARAARDGGGGRARRCAPRAADGAAGGRRGERGLVRFLAERLAVARTAVRLVAGRHRRGPSWWRSTGSTSGVASARRSGLALAGGGDHRRLLVYEQLTPVAICADCGHVKQALKRCPVAFWPRGFFVGGSCRSLASSSATGPADPDRHRACSSRCSPAASWCSTARWGR